MEAALFAISIHAETLAIFKKIFQVEGYRNMPGISWLLDDGTLVTHAFSVV
jgi:cytidine deaminase